MSFRIFLAVVVLALVAFVGMKASQNNTEVAEGVSGIEEAFNICGDKIPTFEARVAAFKDGGWLVADDKAHNLLRVGLAEATTFLRPLGDADEAISREQLQFALTDTAAMLDNSGADIQNVFLSDANDEAALFMQRIGDRIECQYVSSSLTLALEMLFTISGDDVPVEVNHAKILPLRSPGGSDDRQDWSTTTTFIFPNLTYLSALTQSDPVMAFAATMTTEFTPK